MIYDHRPRPSAVGIEPTLGPLDDLAQHLGAVMDLRDSQIAISDAEGIVAKLLWSDFRLEALFPFRAEEKTKAEGIRASLRELSIEPAERQGKPNFLKFLACELEPALAAAVVGQVLAHALEMAPDDLVAYMALDCATGEWFPLRPSS